MQILWSERAYTRRQAIEDYVLYAFGFVAYQDYIDAIEEWKKVLLENPNAGKEEPILSNMRKQYRSFVVRSLSKGIYYVENDAINIVDWWDTRRDIKDLATPRE